MTQEKICQHEAEKLMQSEIKQSGKKAKRKQEIRAKHNVKMSCKRFRYICRIADNKQIAYNTHKTPSNDLVHYTGMRPAKPCLMDEFPLLTEQVLAEVNRPQWKWYLTGCFSKHSQTKVLHTALCLWLFLRVAAFPYGNCTDASLILQLQN